MSLKVSQHIHATLSVFPALVTKVGDRMFPLATIKETLFPFVVYEREGVSPARTKDGSEDEVVYVALFVFSDKYAESVDVAHICRRALDGSRGEYADFSVIQCRMAGAQEAYNDGTFIQKLTFELRIVQ